MKKLIKIATVSVLALLASQANAAQGVVNAHVVQILISDSKFGNCMAKLDQKIATSTNNLSCPGQYVSFACDGSVVSKDIAYRKLDIAQKSEVTGHKVSVFVTDEVKLNGWCYATRIDSYPTN